MGSSDPKKEIPPAVFAGVIGKLLERPRHQEIVVGSDPGPNAAMLKTFEGEPQFLNLVGRTRITELALLLKEAHCVVSTDSGPFHLAWIQGVPTVSLFVAGAPGSTPARWGVYPNFAPSRTIQAPAQGFEPSTILAAVQECALNATEVF
jgi:ADP-heptose:LPS heptosyltransferase